MFAAEQIITVTMDLSQTKAILALAGTVLTTGGLFWATAIRPMIKYLRSTNARLQSIPQLAEDMRVVKEQVHPNGGASLRDSVDRIELRQILDQQVLGSVLSLQSIAFFRADATGAVTEVSRPLCKFLERAEQEVLGNSWFTWINEDVRDEVMAEWMGAIQMGRDFDKYFEMFTDEKEVLAVHLKAYPLMDSHRKVVGYFGSFKHA